mgnify:CR=1 FL=1
MTYIGFLKFFVYEEYDDTYWKIEKNDSDWYRAQYKIS